MRIGIEAQRIFRHKKRGIDLVAIELIRSLQEIDKQNEYIIFVKPDVDRCIDETENFRIVDLPAAPYPIWEQFYLPKAALFEKCDILHCTSNTAPMFCKIPLILTLHDIVSLDNIHSFQKDYSTYQKMAIKYRRFVVPKAVHKSKKIITVSEFEKKCIEDYFNLNDKKVNVIHTGVSKKFKKIDDSGFLENMRKKYHLPEKFILFHGSKDPKRNIKTTLSGYSTYLGLSSEKIPLVILNYNKEKLHKIAKEFNNPDLLNHIITIGYVPNSELPAIYNLTAIMLYPSLRESFGMPILEAMACGVPVITSNILSLSEITDNAALQVDPTQPDEIAHALQKLTTNTILANDLIKKGYLRVADFSWHTMSEKVIEIYDDIWKS